MKSFLYLIFLFASHSTFAQSEQFKQDSVNLQNKIPEIMISKIDKKTSSDTKSNTEKSDLAQNINIVQEINTILNYKVNRIWREDLYCLVCGKDYDSAKVA